MSAGGVPATSPLFPERFGVTVSFMMARSLRTLAIGFLALLMTGLSMAQNATPSEEAAAQAYRQGEFSRAVSLYTKALSETNDPTHRAELHVRIAWTLFALGRESEVPTHLKAAILEDPNLELAPDYYTKEFVDLFNKVRRNQQFGTSPENAAPAPDLEATLMTIQARLDSKKDLEGALADVDRLLEAYPSDGRLLPLKLQVLETLGKTQEAEHVRLLMAAASGATGSEGMAPLETELSVPELILRANRLLDEGDFQTSLELLRKAVSLQPANVAALELLAEASTRAGNWNEAEYALKSALSYQRDNLELQLRLGEVYLAMGNSSAARDVFRAITRDNPHSDRAWAALGLLDARLGNVEKAQKELEKAIEENPLLPEVQLAYGELLLVRGQYPKALEALRTASNLLHADPQVEARLGQALLALNKADAALEHLKAAIAGGFDRPDVQRALILALVATDRLAEAERTLKQAALPTEKGGDLLRALILHHKHDDEAALGLLRQEAERRPNAPRVLNLLAVALYERGRYADAVPIFQRSVELAPDDRVIATNLLQARQAAAARELLEGAINVQNNPKALRD